MEILGMDDERISPFLKAVIMPEGGDVVVVGILADSCMRQMNQNWNSPYENENVGSKLEQGTSAVGRAVGRGMNLTGQTTKSKLNSAQVWESGGHEITLELKFFTTPGGDPDQQVSRALQALEEFASPMLGEIVGPGGRQPGKVIVNVRRTMLMPPCVITSVPVPFGREVDKQGRLLRAEVSLNLKPFMMQDRDDIGRMYGRASIVG